MADPDHLPGLAHLTEHMLFYASEKFPEEDAYSKHVEDHGGQTNAWTSAESTNYQFSVNWDHLASTLDRFAQARLTHSQPHRLRTPTRIVATATTSARHASGVRYSRSDSHG